MKRVLSLLLLISLFASCSKDDGDWEPMKWKSTSSVKEEKGSYIIESEGATVTFICKNYSSPWISGARVGDQYINHNEGDHNTLRGDWFSVKITGNNLEVVINKNTTQVARGFLLQVTAGDIFHTFQFVQKAP